MFAAEREDQARRLAQWGRSDGAAGVKREESLRGREVDDLIWDFTRNLFARNLFARSFSPSD